MLVKRMDRWGGQDHIGEEEAERGRTRERDGKVCVGGMVRSKPVTAVRRESRRREKRQDKRRKERAHGREQGDGTSHNIHDQF